VVNLRKRNSIRDHRLTMSLVFVGDDVRGVEQKRLGDAGKRTASIVRCDHRLSEGRLMQPLSDRAQRVSSLHTVCRGSERVWIRSKRYFGLQGLAVPTGDERRKVGLVTTGRYSKKIDDGYSMLVCFSQPSIIRGIRVFTHEGVVDCLIALKYLAMNFPLVVIPDFAARLRKHRLDRQQETHLLRLEDASLRVDQRNAFSSEEESGLKFPGGQMVMNFIQPSNMIEGSQPHERVETCRFHPNCFAKFLTIWRLTLT
jgi:hypothetical protein